MSSIRNAGSNAGPTLVSRILGMVRDAIMMSVMGVNWASGAFQLAWMVPNMTRRLFGEGALSASFVPRYAAALEREAADPGAKGQADRLLASVSGAMATGLTLLAVAAVTLCLVLPPGTLGLDVDTPGIPADAADALFFELSAILLPYLVPICLVALLAGALNSHGVFALPAAGPILLNIFWIGGLVVAPPLGMTTPAEVAVCVAWFLVAAGVVQLLVLGLALHRRGSLPRPRFGVPPKGDPARRVFASMLPAIAGLSLSQLNTLIDQAMAVYLISPGANNYVYLANRLLLFPHALTTMSMAVAVFPRLSVLASKGDNAGFHRELGLVMGFSLFLAIPASVGLILIGPDLVPLLFEHGRFTEEDSRATYLTTACLVAGLPAMGLAQLYARGLYALEDMKSPAQIAMVLVAVNFGLNLMFVVGLELGTAGLTLATTVSSAINALLLGWLLHRRNPGPTRFWGSMGRSLVGALVMVLGILLLRALWSDDNAGSRVLRVLVAVGVGIVAYAGTQALMGSPEVRAVQRLIARRRS